MLTLSKKRLTGFYTKKNGKTRATTMDFVSFLGYIYYTYPDTVEFGWLMLRINDGTIK